MIIGSEIKKANDQLQSQYFAFVPGNVVRQWLIHFGAKPEDLDDVEQGKVHSHMEKDYEPAMHFRQITIQRNLLIEDGLKENGEIKRVVKDSGCPSTQRFYNNEIASSNTDGAEITINREGCRYWPMPPKNYVQSTVPAAFTRMMNNFVPEKFTGPEMTNFGSKVIIQDQLLIRINKSTDSFECPTPEGIHQDGTQITTVTLSGFHHLESGGDSRIWPLSTPKGCYTDEEFETEGSPFHKKNCLLNYQLRKHWDTILFNDRKVKHEARAFDGARPAYRDVILCDLRKPYTDGVDKMLDVNGNVVSIE